MAKHILYSCYQTKKGMIIFFMNTEHKQFHIGKSQIQFVIRKPFMTEQTVDSFIVEKTIWLRTEILNDQSHCPPHHLCQYIKKRNADIKNNKPNKKSEYYKSRKHENSKKTGIIPWKLVGDYVGGISGVWGESRKLCANRIWTAQNRHFRIILRCF